MPDKLQQFYQTLKANKNIKGLPEDFESFATAMADPEKSNQFYDYLKDSKAITGLPETFNEFTAAFYKPEKPSGVTELLGKQEDIETIPGQPLPKEPDQFKVPAESTLIKTPLISLEQIQQHEEQKKKKQEAGVKAGYAAGEAGLLEPRKYMGKVDLEQERGFGKGQERFVSEQAKLNFGYDKAIAEKKKLSPAISDGDAAVAVVNDNAKFVVEDIYKKKRRDAYKVQASVGALNKEIAAIDQQLSQNPGNNALMQQKKTTTEKRDVRKKAFEDLMGKNYQALYDDVGKFLDTDWTEQDNIDIETLFNKYKKEEWSLETLTEGWYNESAEYKYLKNLYDKTITESQADVAQSPLATAIDPLGTVIPAIASLRATKNLSLKLKEQYKIVLAMSDAVMLNKDWGAVERTNIKALLGSALGKAYTPDIELSEKYVAAVQELGGKITKTQQEAATPTEGELMASMVGSSLNAMGWLMVTTVATQGAGSALGITKALAAIQKITLLKYGKTAAKLVDITVDMAAGALRYGMTPSEDITWAMGAGEEAAQHLMSKLFRGVNVNKIIRPFIRAMAGGSIETVAEYVGEFSSALAKNGWDIDDAVNRAFGETKDERLTRLRHTMILCFGLSMAGQVGKATATKIFKQGMAEMPAADQAVVQAMIDDLPDTDKGVDSDQGVKGIKPLTTRQVMEFEPSDRVNKSIKGADEILDDIEKKRKLLKDNPGQPVSVEASTGQVLRVILGQFPGEITTEEELDKLKKIAEEHKTTAENVLEERKKKKEIEGPQEEKAFQLGEKGYNTKEELFEDIRRLGATETFGKGALPETMDMPTIKAINEFYELEAEAQAKRVGDQVLKETAIKEVKSGEEFHQAITTAAALETNKFGASVTIYSPEAYNETKMFLSHDGKAGLAVTKEGDIVSVFSHGGQKGQVDRLMVKAIKAGGVTLDAFNTTSPEYYSKFGFIPVAKMKWDESQAPVNWNKETYKKFNAGEPDVVYMVYDGGDVNTLSERIGEFADVNELVENAPYAETWEEAKALQQKYLSISEVSTPVDVIKQARQTLKDNAAKEKPSSMVRNTAIRNIAESLILSEDLSGEKLVNEIKAELKGLDIDEDIISQQAARSEQRVGAANLISSLRKTLDAIKNMTVMDARQYAKEFKKDVREDLKTIDKFEAFKDFLNTEKDRLSMFIGSEIYRLGKLSAQATISEAKFIEAIDKISNALDRAEERFTKTAAKKLTTDARKALRKDRANTLLTKINKWIKMDETQLKAEQENIGIQIGNTEVEKSQTISKLDGAEAKETAAVEYNNKIAGYQNEIDMSNLFGNLAGKDLTEVRVAHETLRAIIAEGVTAAKEAEAATNKIVNDLAEQASDETKGDWTEADIIGTEERAARDVSQTSDVRSAFTKFKSHQVAQEYLFKALDKSAEKGRKTYDWTQSAYYKLSKMWRAGQERLNEARHKLKIEFEAGLTDIFGTIGKAKIYATQKIEIQLGYAEKTEDGEVIYKKPKVPITLGQAGHLWMSYQLAENKGYTKRISGIHEGVTYTMEVLDENGDPTDEVFNELDKVLREQYPQMIEYMEWLTDEMLPKALPYITPTYKKLTGHELLTYANYLFVNAKSLEISADSLSDNSFLTIFQSMVKERKGGKYDLTRNDAIFGMYDYIDNTAKFYGLAEPFHIINRVLSKNSVKGMVGKRGLGSYASAIRSLMITHMNGDKDWGRNVGGWLSRYVGSKIMLNAFLAVKQQASIMTILDPKYAPTGRVLAATVRLMKAENRKQAWDILKRAYGLKERHIIRIEGSLKEARSSGWQRNKIDDIKDTLDSIADQLLGNPSPEVRRKWREAMFNILMPTKFGDKFAIKAGGLPIIDASYRQRMEELTDQGMDEAAAQEIAAQYAKDTFLHWMNQTQQSAEMTDKRGWQLGLYKAVVPFMNTNMLYTDRIFDAYQDIWRNTKSQRKYLMDKNPGMNQMTATMYALAQKNNMKALQQIFLYQFVMPNLWDAITTFGFSIRDLWGDDEEKKKKAWVRMGTNTFMGSWIKGIPVAAQFYGAYEAWRDYGIENEDLSAGVLIMFSDLGKAIYYGRKAFEYKGDIKGMSAKEADSVRDKLKSAQDDSFYSGLNALGLPGLVVSRIDEVINQEEYEQEALRRMFRVMGVPKTTIKRYFNDEE